MVMSLGLGGNRALDILGWTWVMGDFAVAVFWGSAMAKRIAAAMRRGIFMVSFL